MEGLGFVLLVLAAAYAGVNKGWLPRPRNDELRPRAFQTRPRPWPIVWVFAAAGITLIVAAHI